MSPTIIVNSNLAEKMKRVKDKFSTQAKAYKKYRPVYPKALYSHILKHTEHRDRCWDCGSGNGQVALTLSSYFNKVFATDISKKQLKEAKKRGNISYFVERAEKTSFGENQFDLITVAQAIHWFDLNAFYAEVRRVAKPNGVLAVWGYGLLKIGEPFDTIINKFYTETIGPYWDNERKHIDAAYQSIDFPFTQVKPSQDFAITMPLHLSDIEGYFNTWSSVQNYRKSNKENPVILVIKELGALWEENTTKVATFPIFVKIGKVVK